MVIALCAKIFIDFGNGIEKKVASSTVCASCCRNFNGGVGGARGALALAGGRPYWALLPAGPNPAVLGLFTIILINNVSPGKL